MSEPRPLSYWQRASFWWTLFALALSFRILHRPESHTVFPVFAQGSLHWWSGESLYLDYKPLDFFRYPPQFAILFSPFAWLGPAAGGWAWGMFSLCVYGYGLSRFARTVLPSRVGERGRQLFLNLSLLGGVVGLWNGQCNAVLVGLLLIAGSAIAERRWWLASSLLVLACFCKLTPLPLVLLLLALWPRHLIGRCCVAASALLVLPYLCAPPTRVHDQYREFVGQLADQSEKRWPGFRDGWLMWTVTRHLVEGGEGLPDLEAPLDGRWYRVVQLATAGGLLFFLLNLKRRKGESRLLLLAAMGGGAAWALLLGPASEAPTYVLLAPFLAWGFVDRKAWPHPRRIEMATFLVFIVGWGTLTRGLWPVAPWLILVLPMGVLAFSCWLIGGFLERHEGHAVPLPPCHIKELSGF